MKHLTLTCLVLYISTVSRSKAFVMCCAGGVPRQKTMDVIQINKDTSTSEDNIANPANHDENKDNVITLPDNQYEVIKTEYTDSIPAPEHSTYNLNIFKASTDSVATSDGSTNNLVSLKDKTDDYLTSPKDQIKNQSTPKDNNGHPTAPEDNTDVMIMIFFRDYFAKYITKTVSKIVILVLWAVYIGIAIWGCIELEQGLQLKNLAPDDSYVVGFYEHEELYFTKYPFSVQVVIHSHIDSREKANEVEILLTEFETSPYFHGSTFTESWLRDYEIYSNSNNYSISYDDLFTSFFDTFLQEPAYAKYDQDIIKVETTNRIFRFLVMAKDISDTTVERALMEEARRIASDFPDLDVTVFTARFIMTEQYVAILPNTLQNLGIATCSMIIISLLLIPHPLVSVWVALSIVSISIGVIGYMTFWDVNLDSVSMVNLIMCIGFCVDFSAHITYAFVTSKNVERSDRVRDSLYSLGMPILQGSVSTILGVSVLGASFAYIFRTFFKIMSLVILFGTLHGLFLLPVLLSLVGPKGSIQSTSCSDIHGLNKIKCENKKLPERRSSSTSF